MISFELAKKKAKEVIPKVDAYYEYPDAYWFRIAKPSKDDQHHSSKVSILQHSAFFIIQLSSIHDYWKNHTLD